MNKPLALAPLSYAWQSHEITDFYSKVATRDEIQRVYLGEVVCRKRATLALNQWLEIADHLVESGKQVIFSLPWLINSASDERYVEKVLSKWTGLVEANDLTTVAAAGDKKRPFVGGNQLQIYNAATLAWMISQGMTIWTPPVEMSKYWLDDVASTAGALPHVELFAFGRAMLGISARCMQARVSGASRQTCERLCLSQPAPVLEKLDGEALLVANGHTIMSEKDCNLLALESKIPDYVDSLRISLSLPEQLNVIDTARQTITSNQCNGFWFGRSGAEQVVTTC